MLKSGRELKYHFILIVGILNMMGLFFGLTPQTVYAATCKTVSGGNWSNPAIWTNCNGGIPTANDDVQVGHSVNLDISVTIKSFFVTAGFGGAGSFYANGNTFTVLEDFKTAFNDIGAWPLFDAGSSTINVGGNWDNGGVFNAGTSTVNFNGTSSQSIGATYLSSVHFYKMNIMGGHRTISFTTKIGLGAASDWSGTSCLNSLKIRSNNTGIVRIITNTSFLTANWLDVKDSSADTPISINSGRNSGNNTNWNFTTQCIGSATLASSTGVITNDAVMDNATATTACGGTPPPSGYKFPYGFLAYNITGLANGATTHLTATFPSGHVGAKLLKCNSANQWVNLPNTSDNGDNIFTYSLTDGVSNNDHDSIANGTIVDPIVFAIPDAVGGVAEVITIPTASTNGLGYMAGMVSVVMLVGAGWLLKRRG